MAIEFDKKAACAFARATNTRCIHSFSPQNLILRKGQVSVQPQSSLADSFGGSQEAEAQVVVPIAWIVPIPAGRPHVARVVDPTAATDDTVRALRCLPVPILT